MQSTGLMRLEACLVDLPRNKIYRDGRSISLTESEARACMERADLLLEQAQDPIEHAKGGLPRG